RLAPRPEPRARSHELAPERTAAPAAAANSAPAARRATRCVYRSSPSNTPSWGCAWSRVLLPGTLARMDARERAYRDVFTAVPGRSTRDRAHAQDSLTLRSLRAVLRPPLPPIVDAGAIARAADDVVAHTRQILHAAAANQHDRVLLQVMAFAADVARNLEPVGQANARHLAHRRVRLLRRRRVDASAHAALLRRGPEGRNVALFPLPRPRLAHQLVSRRH